MAVCVFDAGGLSRQCRVYVLSHVEICCLKDLVHVQMYSNTPSGVEQLGVFLIKHMYQVPMYYVKHNRWSQVATQDSSSWSSRALARAAARAFAIQFAEDVPGREAEGKSVLAVKIQILRLAVIRPS